MRRPGFVDPHTHYDAQLFWDPTATPSNVHGVTTVIGGNCGFTLAPLHAGDADYLRRMMAKVEGMPLAALEQGVDWKWETFGEYLDRLEGGIAVNAGFLVGHCAIRRYVMGADAIGSEATPEQIAEMRAELGTSRSTPAALGFSTTQSSTHTDGDGQPVASPLGDARRAARAVRGDRRARGHHARGHRRRLPRPVLRRRDRAARRRSSAAADRPLNWNVLTVDSREPERVPRQLGAATAAAELGGRLVALTMPVLVPMNMSFLTYCALWLIPGWSDDPERCRCPSASSGCRDPETRAQMLERSQSPEAGVFRRLADFGDYRLGDTYAAGERGRSRAGSSRDIAAERGSRTSTRCSTS